MFKCSLCNQPTNSITYRPNGMRVCGSCNNSSRSGVWERNNQAERNKYARDILQPGTAGYEEIYGKEKK